MFFFGSGDAVATPFGNSAAPNPTPMKLGTLQETGVDFSFGQKELMGKNSFPVAIARAGGKANLKFKFAGAYAKLWNDLLFGSTITTGSECGIADQVVAVITHASTPTPPGGGTFSRNLGVRNGTTGLPMTLVATAPAAGVSYTFAAGVYTFNASEAATTMFISYTYTKTTGFKSSVANPVMGNQPAFDLTVFNTQYVDPFNGSSSGLLRFPTVITTKLGMPFKNEDWMIHEFDCSGFQDVSGNVLYFNADE